MPCPYSAQGAIPDGCPAASAGPPSRHQNNSCCAALQVFVPGEGMPEEVQVGVGIQILSSRYLLSIRSIEQVRLGEGT